MVSRLIITNQETRDFTRKLAGVFMLVPEERLWGNHTIISVRSAEDSTTTDDYTGSSADMSRLFGKIEAYDPHASAGMRARYEQVHRLVDVWKAPPIPVVCVIGSGKPTATHFGYCDDWPDNLNEEPCNLKYEDGDITVIRIRNPHPPSASAISRHLSPSLTTSHHLLQVPRRSSESVCRAWSRQRRCLTSLTSVHKARCRDG